MQQRPFGANYMGDGFVEAMLEKGVPDRRGHGRPLIQGPDKDYCDLGAALAAGSAALGATGGARLVTADG